MDKQYTASGGENFNLRDILLHGRKLSLAERSRFFSNWIERRAEHGESLYLREVSSAAGREVEVADRFSGRPRKMLMFGSNNYLGLTSHPYVQARVRKAVDEYGAGVGGPPLLNGYTTLHRALEERLAAFKRTEEVVLFQSGYGANVGMLSSLTGRDDLVLHDAHCHASFLDGLKMSGATGVRFAHNDVAALADLLAGASGRAGGDTFVGVQGVYSMDGDLAPLDRIVPLCKRHGALILLDDAHGTGVTGPGGRGTTAHFDVTDQVDLAMGTFSKAFGVLGGFVATSKPLADYLRFFARSYMFSSSLPPPVLATVLAVLDLLEREPAIHQRLTDNVAYAAEGLRGLGFDVHPEGAIIPLHTPPAMNMRKAAYHFHRAGIFINAIEYPAVPAHRQRFRISLMATHTRQDIDRLLACVEEVWALYADPEHAEAAY